MSDGLERGSNGNKKMSDGFGRCHMVLRCQMVLGKAPISQTSLYISITVKTRSLGLDVLKKSVNILGNLLLLFMLSPLY